ncbi:hypothetical protein AC579_19 [Pseudocercospora musae]|uniref:F-box domain-containing protein n=1 Tax=Pseudocercospora musae TaxID=113226 RepID=A0A139GU92_9PEZI|nr:hypothetical protein AC579_19 [Pseudocercospora musae]
MEPTKAKKTLKQCLESLPQELWNEIYDLTFSTPDLDPRTHVTGQRLKSWILFTANPPSTMVHISKNYKPPWQLQICRQMREEFSRAYYTSTFVGNASDIFAWASSKRKSQQRRIESIHCWVREEEPEIAIMGTLLAYYEQSDILRKRLKELMVPSIVVLAQQMRHDFHETTPPAPQPFHQLLHQNPAPCPKSSSTKTPFLRYSQQMRQDFHETYYNTTFVGYTPDMVSWFRSLHNHDRALVKSIQCWLVSGARRARVYPARSRGFLRGCKTYSCTFDDLGAKEAKYCLYKDCIEKKLRDGKGQ